MADDQSDFEYQLQAQQYYQQQQQQSGDTAQTYVDPTDGTVYEWDAEKRAWFPKVDSDFLAAYQSSYGFYQPTEQASTTAQSTTDQPKAPAEKSPAKHAAEARAEEAPPTKKRLPSTPGWFEVDDTHNTNVYVSGLPLDTTIEDFHTLMSKCGIIMEEDGELKLKLYRDVNGELKGDGLCCYLKKESVELALSLLDQSDFNGSKISVQRAKFQMKGTYNPDLKKKKKPNKKKGKAQERLLDWRERKEGPSHSKYDKIVIFKHLFNPKEFEDDPMLINDIRDDLRQECEKFGEVKKVLIFDRHADGIGSVAFKEFESAEMCLEKMNGRWYGGKQLEVGLWDGVTNYQVEETEKEREKRLEQWENFLKSGDSSEPNNNNNT